MLLLFLVLGIVGTGTELLLIEHVEDRVQLVPLALFPLALGALTWHGLSKGAASVRALQLVMALFVVSGGFGVYLHYTGNVEFELEMYPDRAGFELFRESMMGATPVLAPGTMALLGLIGLVYAYQHPTIAARRSENRATRGVTAPTRIV